ncbi:MAG: SDR family oxidoreductase [Caulobacterales bacterium]
MRTVLITGANRGIGLAHARLYVERGALVYAAVRAPHEADDLSALAAAHPGQVVRLAYDARDPLSPAAVKRALGDAPIDLLFNNAGVGDRAGFGDVQAGDFLNVMAINALAPLLLAQALIDNVAASKRRLIANQSSQLGSISEASGGAFAYRASKAALNMITKSLAQDLAARDVTVVCLHPGWVRTRMGGPNAPVEVEASAAGQQKVLDGLGLEDSGSFFNFDGKRIPW